LTTIKGVTLQVTDNHFFSHRCGNLEGLSGLFVLFFLLGAGLLSLTKPELAKLRSVN